MSKLATVALLKAKVKYCVPDLPVFKSGPAGRYPLLRSVVKCRSDHVDRPLARLEKLLKMTQSTAGELQGIVSSYPRERDDYEYDANFQSVGVSFALSHTCRLVRFRS